MPGCSLSNRLLAQQQSLKSKERHEVTAGYGTFIFSCYSNLFEHNCTGSRSHMPTDPLQLIKVNVMNIS